jgi:hypothetical protein
VIEHPATTHEEYRYERSTSTDVTEYRWSVYTRTTTPGTDAVVCGPELEEPPVDTEQPSVAQPSTQQPSVEPQDVSSVRPSAPATRAHRAAAVPTVIDAGL